jgi:hypothetical protein
MISASDMTSLIQLQIGGKCRAFKSPSNFVFAVREELHPGAFNLVNPGVEQLMYKRTLLKDLGIKLEKCGQPNLEGEHCTSLNRSSIHANGN